MNVSRTSAQIRRPLAFVLAVALTFASCGGGDTVSLNAEGSSGAIELEPTSTIASAARDGNNDEPDQSTTTTGVSTTTTTAVAGARARTVKPCSDFTAHADAQRYFSLDPVGRVSLDPDGDGTACEDLPDAPVAATTTAAPTTTAKPTTTTAKPTTTIAPTTTAAPTTTVAPTTTAAQVSSDVPSVNTQSVPDGATVNLASFVRGDKPVVFWSWAPH